MGICKLTWDVPCYFHVLWYVPYMFESLVLWQLLSKWEIKKPVLNPFHVHVPVLYSLKMLEYQTFSDVFRRYRLLQLTDFYNTGFKINVGLSSFIVNISNFLDNKNRWIINSQIYFGLKIKIFTSIYLVLMYQLHYLWIFIFS